MLKEIPYFFIYCFPVFLLLKKKKLPCGAISPLLSCPSQALTPFSKPVTLHKQHDGSCIVYHVRLKEHKVIKNKTLSLFRQIQARYCGYSVLYSHSRTIFS